jgi:FlaA1/EpsC-like NDP-sugar epimerase
MRISRRSAVIIHDLLMIAVAWELAWLARFNFESIAPPYWWANLLSLPVVVLVQGVVSWRFGLYNGLWRFASIPDLVNILRNAGLVYCYAPARHSPITVAVLSTVSGFFIGWAPICLPAVEGPHA